MAPKPVVPAAPMPATSVARMPVASMAPMPKVSMAIVPLLLVPVVLALTVKVAEVEPPLFATQAPGWQQPDGTTPSERVGRRNRVAADMFTKDKLKTIFLVAVGDLTVERGVAPQLWTAHPWGPSQNIPIRASKGMTCPDHGEIGFGRGRGFTPVVFPTPLLLV